MSKHKSRNLSGRDNRRRRAVVFNRDGNACLFCGSSENLTLDHKLPLARGGSNRIENLQTLCFRCNQAKAAKPLHVIEAHRRQWGVA